IRAVEALKERDLEESQQVVYEDDIIDQKRYEIEDRCIDLIATQQPMARDLRAIIALLHITVELERMGDYAEGIGKISILMGEQPPLKPLIDIPRMAEKSTEMLRESIEALVDRDVIKANKVLQDDDEVDALYDQVYRELLLFMIQDPHSIQRATYLLWAAHDLERIADRATNIAERVIFLVTGKMVESNDGSTF
ncbi:MAG: phosphate signaling complex protein PhoU, partial [Dehalococcoidia bacterium]